MQKFEKIDVKELDNAIKAIGDDWMLITAYDSDNNRTNAMTASWGALGVLWHKPICICFVRPERHTFKLLNEKKVLSIAFLDEKRRNDYMVCGRESGASIDKLQKCGLTTVELDGASVIAEASTALTCRVLYEDDIKEIINRNSYYIEQCIHYMPCLHMSKLPSRFMEASRNFMRL